MKNLSICGLTAAAILTMAGTSPVTAYGAVNTYGMPGGMGSIKVISNGNIDCPTDLSGIKLPNGASNNITNKLPDLILQGKLEGCDLDELLSGIKRPENSVPSQPGGSLPDNSVPSLPGGSLPDNSVPSLPDGSLPENSVPGQPGGNLPDISLPGQPDDNLPDNSLPGDSDNHSAFVKRVVELVNEERAKAGLSPLTIDAQAMNAADVRAREITTSFSHNRPDGNSFSTALTQAGVKYRSSGENIAYGQKTPEEVMKSWMNSDGHRANILNGNFTSIGVGHYQNSAGVSYWVQLFAG